MTRIGIWAERSRNSSRRGSVAISGCGQKDLSAVCIRLCGEPLELLGERQLAPLH
jgi:hypothetical protein